MCSYSKASPWVVRHLWSSIESAIQARMQEHFTRDYYTTAQIDLHGLLQPYLARDPQVVGPDFDRRLLVDLNRDLFPKDEFAGCNHRPLSGTKVQLANRIGRKSDRRGGIDLTSRGRDSASPSVCGRGTATPMMGSTISRNFAGCAVDKNSRRVPSDSPARTIQGKQSRCAGQRHNHSGSINRESPA